MFLNDPAKLSKPFLGKKISVCMFGVTKLSRLGTFRKEFFFLGGAPLLGHCRRLLSGFSGETQGQVESLGPLSLIPTEGGRSGGGPQSTALRKEK